MGVSGINMYGLWDYRFPTLGDRRPGRDLHADRHRDRVPSCSWTTRAFAGVAAPLRRVLRRPRVDASRAHDEAGPNRTGTSWSGARPARCYRTASRTASGSRTRVPGATIPCPTVGRSRSYRAARLRRRESHPLPGLMRPGCSLVHHAAMEETGTPAKPLDGFEPSGRTAFQRGY